MRKPALLLAIVFLLHPLVSSLALAETINVNAVVPAKPSDFAIQISTTDTTNPVEQSHVIPVKITYKNTLSYPTTLQIKASWARGTLEGDADPSVNILHFVDSSASKGYGGAIPVVNTVNRTITWTIPSYPGNGAENEVAFSLVTSDNFTSASRVNFSIKGSLSAAGIQKNSSLLERQYLSSISSTTPTPTSPITPTTSVTTPTPTPAPTNTFSIQEVGTTNILFSSVGISVNLSSPGTITIRFGTKPDALTQRATSGQTGINHIVNLSSLNSNTTYYYQVVARDSIARTVRSSIYSVKTSTFDLKEIPPITSFVVTSNDIILSTNDAVSTPSSESAEEKSDQVATPITIPSSSLYEFRFNLPPHSDITRVEAFLRNTNVLGINNLVKKAYAETELVELIETSPGVYLGRFRAPTIPGNYALYLRISDTKGNVLERKVSQIKITHPFTVLARNTKKPVEGAEIRLSVWNTKTNKFERVRTTSLNIPNPAFSDRNGVVDLTLPSGTYKAEIRTLTFKTENVTFTIGKKDGDGYPEALLTNASFQPLNIVLYFKSSLENVFFVATKEYLASLALSSRILDLISITGLIGLALMMILSFSKRVQIPLFSLPSFYLYHMRLSSRPRGTSSFSGEVTDHVTDEPIPGVNVYLLNDLTHQLIAHGTTNSQGKFTISNIPENSYLLNLLKTGYQEFSIYETIPVNKSLKFALAAHPAAKTTLEKLWGTLEHLLAVSFEAILAFVFMVAVAIGFHIGWVEILPILLLGALNLFIWHSHKRL